MTITVTNYCKGGINVSINEWGTDGKTGWFSVDHGATEPWSRSDPRGFIMRVRTYGDPYLDLPYFVFANSSISVHDMTGGQDVRDGGSNLNPAGQGGSTTPQ